MSDTITATACMFMRKKNSDWEVGIAITDKGPGIYDIDVIVDKKGRAVRAPIWSYNLLEEMGTFTVNSDEIIKIW